MLLDIHRAVRSSSISIIMTQPLITVENLSKAYRIGAAEEIPDTLASAAKSWIKSPFKNFKKLSSLNTFNDTDSSHIHWALKNISFEVDEGEVIGIIGHNGAGKSTLLKILSRITQPTKGQAIIRGRISSLLEVGTGFHPELSGRENVYMNGTILGMKKVEIDSNFDEIVEFSGIGKFLDTPIKRYSSGMKVRLAFSIAAYLEPEILVIDEVLAVGDQEFQNKCLGKMQDVAKSGRTVLFVSHNMAAVESLCTRGILLKNGEIALTGHVGDVTTEYLKPSACADIENTAHYSSDNSLIREVQLLNSNSEVTDAIGAGSAIRLRINLQTEQPLTNLTVRIVLTTENGVRVCNCNSRIETNRLFHVQKTGTIEAHLPRQRLAPGKYLVAVGIFHHGEELESVDPAFAFDILATDIFGTGLLPSSRKAVYLPECEWILPND